MWYALCSIQLVRYAERIASHEHVIVQEYIDKPLLVDGFKCDLRIYVLITSCSPLRVFLFSDGLLRMSTERYVSPSESNMVCLLSAVIGINVNITTIIYLPSSPIDTTHFFGHICPVLEFLGGGGATHIDRLSFWVKICLKFQYLAKFQNILTSDPLQFF